MSIFSSINTRIGKTIDTVADLPSLRAYWPSRIQDGDTVLVTGNLNIGDQDGGAYVWVEDAQDADDGVATIRPGHVVGKGRWVKMFGKGDRGPQGPTGQGEGADVGKLITDKLFVIPRSAWLQDSPNVPEAGDKNFYVRLDLATIRAGGVRSQDKAILTLEPLEFPFPNSSVHNPDYTASVLWIDNTQVRIYLMTKAEMTGWVMKVRLTEYE